jgi:hypothetical protein
MRRDTRSCACREPEQWKVEHGERPSGSGEYGLLGVAAILVSVADGVADLHAVLAGTEAYMTDELMRRPQAHPKHIGGCGADLLKERIGNSENAGLPMPGPRLHRPDWVAKPACLAPD